MDGADIDSPTHSAEAQTRRRERLRRPLMIGGPALLLIFLAYWFFTGGRYETTDDAFVQTARVAISANVSGRVSAIAVHDNQRVRKGDVLFRIEDNLFQIAANEAAAELATARLQIEMLKANYRQRQAEEKSAHDTLIYNTYQLDRQQRLHTAGITSQVQVERSRHALQEASAAYSAATRISRRINIRPCNKGRRLTSAPSSICPTQSFTRRAMASSQRWSSFKRAATSMPPRPFSHYSPSAMFGSRPISRKTNSPISGRDNRQHQQSVDQHRCLAGLEDRKITFYQTQRQPATSDTTKRGQHVNRSDR